jgi:hypothetical protein
LRAVSALPSDTSASDDASAASDADLPAGLGDAWLLLTHLQSQTATESRLVASITYDLGLLGRHVRRTGIGIDWIAQALEAIERDTERMQRIASASGVSADLADDAGGAMFAPRPASASIPRHAPLVTRPLEADMRLPADLDGPQTPQPSASDSTQRTASPPGSIRTSDLIGFAPLGDQPASTSSGPLAEPPSSADPQAQ